VRKEGAHKAIGPKDDGNRRAAAGGKIDVADVEGKTERSMGGIERQASRGKKKKRG